MCVDVNQQEELDVDVVPCKESDEESQDEVEEEEELEVDEEAVQCFLEVGERLVLQ